MNSSYYKYCVVPQCESTTIKTPNKLFIYVPKNKKMRRKWLEMARRQDAHVLSTDSTMYFCEDHFDLPNDMENYMEYHVMGSVSQVRMKPGCMPHKFVCQKDRKTRTSDTTERQYIAKKRRMMILEECVKEFKEKNRVTEQSGSQEIASTSSGPLFASAVKREMEDPASELIVKKEYDPYESICSNYSSDLVVDYDIPARKIAHNYLDNECIKQEIVKSEKTDSTLHCLEMDNSALPRIVKNDNDFEEDSKDVIRRQIEFMDAHDSRNIIDDHSLNNEKRIWTDDCQKGNADLNSFNECFKEEMVDYGQIDTPSNQISMRVENEVDFKELSDNEFVKKEIEFVDVQEEKHIVDQCLYNEKQMENPDELVIETKIVKTNAQRQKEYRMRKKIQKQLLCPKKLPKTNAQRQQEYRENRKKMELSEELDLVRKKMNAERAKRYRDNLKLKKQQAQIDSLLSSKEDFLPT